MQMTTTSGGRTARLLLAAALLCVGLAVLASSASAAPYRKYVTQLSFKQPEAVTTLPNGNLLVSDVGTGTLEEYTPYPDLKKVGERAPQGQWGGSTQVHSMAESAANGFLYTATDGEELKSGGSCGGTPFTIFDDFGAIFHAEREQGCESWVAVDNDPQSDNYGHFFRYEENKIQQFDGYGNPVPFSASASYIHDNEITETPFSPLYSGGSNPEMSGITVDDEGNIWVLNSTYERREIDEFAPNGEFIRRINEGNSEVPELPGKFESHIFGYYPGLTGIDLDPITGDVATSDKAAGAIVEFSPQGKFLGTTDGSETPQGSLGFECTERFCITHVMGVAFDDNGYMYVADGFGKKLDVFAPRPTPPSIEYKPDSNPTATSTTLNAVVDADGGGPITSCKFDFGASVSYSTPAVPCAPSPVGSSGATEVHADFSGLTTETTYHYRVEVGNANETRIGPDGTITPHGVLGLRAEAATDVGVDSATLNGSFVGNGAQTKYWFEYGTSTAYGKKVPLPAPPGADAGAPTGPARTDLAQGISGLAPVTRYHYRVVAENGTTSVSDDFSFRTRALLPQITRENVTDVHSNQLVLHALFNPGGADTVYSFEYGLEDCEASPDACTQAFVDTHIGSTIANDPGSKHLLDLEPGTTYYYRGVATNLEGTTYGPVRTFSTYRFPAELKDSCPNVLSRQQTGAALVTDCRSYELVSSAHAGGYDVESDLVPSQVPFEGYPRVGASPRVLYGIHNGAIPGVPGNPTNKGVDPYLASRSDGGWTTSYVGISASDPNATEPFASTLAEADQGLDSFAFGGDPAICSPCFADGSTGVPIRSTGGDLTQGMKGSIPQPTATADGLVRRRFSADGSHFVFSSTSQFEPAGNDDSGDVSIYDRDLKAGTTQVVSTDAAGAALTCLPTAGSCHAPGDADGIAELDISADGSRILVGQKVGSDGAGNAYYRLFMHIGDSTKSVALNPGATAGALFDGMTADGSHVFITTRDQLLGADTDASADIYEAAIDGSGVVTLRLLSSDGATASNDDSCAPAGSPSWNAVAGNGKCDAVAFAGGAGVASQSGSFYFVSPELLDGAEGVQDQPNLYGVAPGGNPRFIATLEPDNPAIVHGVRQSATHFWSDFQVTPSGRFAAFTTRRQLDEGYENLEHSEVYRFDAVDGARNCVSCPPTNALATSDAAMATHGLSLVDDGRVFFNTTEPLVLRDGDNTQDVYEWEEEGQGPAAERCDADNPNLFPTGICLSLISAGTSQFDSSLLSAGADGIDAFFFTHDSLAPEDENGPLAKLYDARVEGGFFHIPPPALCAASDECHGPGTTAAAPSQSRTKAGTPGNLKAQGVTCKKGYVKKKGKCVRKKQQKRHHKRHHGRRR